MKLDLTKIILGYNKDNIFININDKFELDEVQRIPIHVTSQDIQEQLNNDNFSKCYESVGGKNNKDKSFENARLVPFNLPYYFLAFTEQKIPTLQQITQEYLSRFCQKSKKFSRYYQLQDHYLQLGYSDILFTERTLTARMGRGYNSFNRELELGLRFKQEPDLFVKYDFRDDYFNGIDLSVMFDDFLAGIACYQDSIRAEAFKKLKETTRRNNYDKSTMIPMKINMEKPDTYKRSGDTLFFSDTMYQDVLQQIYKKEIKNDIS